MVAVHARKKLVQELQYVRVHLSVRVIAPNYLELHMRVNICVTEIQNFLLPNKVKCLI